MAVIKVGKGRSEVTITGALAVEIDAEIREILGPVADEMQDVIDQKLDEARAVYPELTGAARKSLKSALRVDPGSFTIEVIAFSQGIRYTFFIKSTKVRRRQDMVRLRSPFVEHVRKPVIASRQFLLERLPQILADTINDGALSG